MPGLTVVTYGGGEILQSVFNAVSMLMSQQQGGFIRPFALITASAGGVWALGKAFFSSSIQHLLLHYFLPLVAIVGLLMIPTTTVHIEDVLRDRCYRVDHVPILLGRFSELASSCGYQITRAIEGVMHVPRDQRYSSTGMIFGADSALDLRRYQISDANLEKNLKTFCKQCVVYDIALGCYTLDEMKKSTDLWKFFQEKTSKVRMMPFALIGTPDQGRGPYLSCREAIEEMTPYFEKEKGYHGKLDVCRHLPLTFQALTGMQQSQSDLISQQLMMSTLLGEYGGDRFAKGRAYLQQRNTYQTLGALASSSLVTLRVVLEALVYAAFIFVLPLSLLPGGLRFLKTWSGLVLWIQLWPPFYAILNLIMQTVSQSSAESLFACLPGAQRGLSLFTNFGLHNLQQDIFALSGYLALSIPFITYALLKGGVGSFIHLASSMMTPVHTAASAAAAEQTTANYSFGNTGFRQMHYQNTSGLQTSLAPNLSTGFFYENRGSHATISSGDEQILKQSSSDLRTNFFSDESISESLHASQMQAESNLDTATEAYSSSIQRSARYGTDLAEHLSESTNLSSSLSQREAADIQESARFLMSESEGLARQHGISTKESFELLTGFGVNFIATAKGSYASAANREELMNEAKTISTGEDFQKHYQKLQDFSRSEAHTTLNESGRRLSESFLQSVDEMKSSQEGYQQAHSSLEQISETANWVEQNSQLVKRSLSQDFVNWASERFQDSGGYGRVEEILTSGDHKAQGELASDFVQHMRESLAPVSLEGSPASKGMMPRLDLTTERSSIQAEITGEKANLFRDFSKDQQRLEGNYESATREANRGIERIPKKVSDEREKLSKELKEENEEPLFKRVGSQQGEKIGRMIVEANPVAAAAAEKFREKREEPLEELASNFQLKEEPFWLKGEES